MDTFISVVENGKFILRTNPEGLSVNLTIKMSTDQEKFFNQLKGSAVFREILEIAIAQGALLRASENWDAAIRNNGNIPNVLL